jgi:hypothetical protein
LVRRVLSGELRGSKSGRTVARTLFYEARRSAGKRSLQFEITFEDVIDLLNKADGRCEVTGVKFSDVSWGAYRRPFMPSLDRKDPREGYTFDNCRIVCVAANFAMGEWGEEVLHVMLRSMHGIEEVPNER